ncbi:MAG: acyltransferase [Okeania sp. SIO3B5]|uniref:acyltransferase n=1 Tax=Okeania sp. SIO3B5 TaxID=2607811 RepID=UPI0014018B5C|nr:acyltransferase [Okeania sp. SIO3B5]NEO57262.1 acyltransferase [Okeania sp. SIO3B5]
MAKLEPSVIESMGFASIGKNVTISDKASFYNCANISIGNSARIDDFCVLSAGEGGIFIGNHVHIAVYSSLIGAGKITLSDFSGLSSRVSIYSSNDDYSGATMTNPTIPSQYAGVTHGDVYLGKHVIIGSGTVILPGVTLEEGVAVGALSLVRKNCKAFGIYLGYPAKFVKKRKRDLLELEKAFLSSLNQ